MTDSPTTDTVLALVLFLVGIALAALCVGSSLDEDDRE